jgi:hypothetical protein
MKSWRTTVFGTGGLLAVVVTILQALFDGNPQTNPDWGAAAAAIAASVGLLFARDHKVSSEDAGIK